MHPAFGPLAAGIRPSAALPRRSSSCCLIGALVALAVFDLLTLWPAARAALFTLGGDLFHRSVRSGRGGLSIRHVGALIVAWAALWIWKVRGRAVSARRSGVASSLAALPWFHTKFVVFLAIFAAALAFRLRGTSAHSW
jgi:hypothetical protein